MSTPFEAFNRALLDLASAEGAAPEHIIARLRTAGGTIQVEGTVAVDEREERRMPAVQPLPMGSERWGRILDSYWADGPAEFEKVLTEEFGLAYGVMVLLLDVELELGLEESH